MQKKKYRQCTRNNEYTSYDSDLSYVLHKDGWSDVTTDDDEENYDPRRPNTHPY